MRTVRRQKIASASLFDQRRMTRIHGADGASMSGHTSSVGVAISVGEGGDSRRVKYSPLLRGDSTETIELTRNTREYIGKGKGIGKVPKSPAPNLQTV